jgi:hypothetical protein
MSSLEWPRRPAPAKTKNLQSFRALMNSVKAHAVMDSAGIRATPSLSKRSSSQSIVSPAFSASVNRSEAHGHDREHHQVVRQHKPSFVVGNVGSEIRSWDDQEDLSGTNKAVCLLISVPWCTAPPNGREPRSVAMMPRGIPLRAGWTIEMIRVTFPCLLPNTPRPAG